MMMTVLVFLTAAVLLGVLTYLWRKYISGGMCTSQARLDRKTVIITGANTGIGKETALDLAARGARVILACRDIKRGQEAAAEIRAQVPNAEVVVRRLDLASLQSVKEFAQRIYETEERLDVLINNAGVAWCPRGSTQDGFELHFGVNHLGHFLLTNLLLDLLVKSGPSRIVIVSARCHQHGYMNWEDINWEERYSPFAAYNQSKLANHLFTRELSQRLEGTGVTVNCLHPGVVKTDIAKYIFFKEWNHVAFCWLYFLLFKNPREGAQTSIFCAVDESLEGKTGLYFSDCKEKEMAPLAKDKELAKKVWDLSAELVGLNEQECWPHTQLQSRRKHVDLLQTKWEEFPFNNNDICVMDRCEPIEHCLRQG
ncbi:retinol dehydrogenase 12 [Lingula anatina]|uniref:Retinol dehydrogenase 12 n=1 Tax=Lingula anatina TaxID=7574 RepID=A0A1S3J9Z0_LINAN|nr:retinol dehydrogenase 12 [Lingula anatina]|eukprot:XP_013407222.1 retinol dehydrogenase 12 [Lingula anatina]